MKNPFKMGLLFQTFPAFQVPPPDGSNSYAPAKSAFHSMSGVYSNNTQLQTAGSGMLIPSVVNPTDSELDSFSEMLTHGGSHFNPVPKAIGQQEILPRPVIQVKDESVTGFTEESSGAGKTSPKRRARKNKSSVSSMSDLDLVRNMYSHININIIKPH